MKLRLLALLAFVPALAAAAMASTAPPIFDDEPYLAYLRRLGVKQQRYQRQITGLAPDRKTPGFTPCGGWIEQEDGRPFPPEGQYSYYLVQRALEKLDAALADGGGAKPIYLQLDIFDPHNPFSIPAGFEERERQLRAAFAELPASYEACLARDWRPDPVMPRIYGFYQKNWGMYARELITDYRVANALQMEVVDRALAQFIKGLKERGLYDEAVVIFTADHGEMNGRHGLCDKGVYLYPDTLRVPLAVKMPASRGIKPHAIDAPVSHLDLAATLLELVGVVPQARLDGRSLLPYLDGNGAPADRALFFECGQHRTVNAACGIQHWDGQGGHYLFVYNLGSSIDELYDLNSTDAINLSADPKFAATRLEMIRRLGSFLQVQPRYKGYWASFQIDYYEVKAKQLMRLMAQGYDGSKFDIMGLNFFNQADACGNKVVPWDFERGAPFTARAMLEAQEKKVAFVQNYVRRATGRFPVIVGNGGGEFFAKGQVATLLPFYCYDLGRPRQSFDDVSKYETATAGVYRREFTKGLVLVNATDHDVPDIVLGMPWHDPDEKRMVQTTPLPAHTGKILLGSQP